MAEASAPRPLLLQICEFHLKAHVVQKNGSPHRFCQQVGAVACTLQGAHGWADACCCRCWPSSSCGGLKQLLPRHASPLSPQMPPVEPVQCGKFQPLEDFDGDKRSCRARLDKHNARRRRQREMAHMLKKTGTIDEKVRLLGGVSWPGGWWCSCCDCWRRRGCCLVHSHCVHTVALLLLLAMTAVLSTPHASLLTAAD